MNSEAVPFCLFLVCMLGHSMIYALVADQNLKDMFFISSITWMITCLCQLYYHMMKLTYHPTTVRDERIMIVLHVFSYILSFGWAITLLIKLENNMISGIHQLIFITMAISFANMSFFIIPILKHRNGFMLMCGYNIVQTILNYAISILCYYIMEKIIDLGFLILVYVMALLGSIVMLAILYVKATNPLLFDQEPMTLV